MTSDLRVAILGAGYIASWHADAIRATPGAQLVAVCDPARDAAEALAASYGIQAFADLDQMIAAIAMSSAKTIAKPAFDPTCRISSTGSSDTMPKATAPVDSSTPRKLKKPDQTTA